MTRLVLFLLSAAVLGSCAARRIPVHELTTFNEAQASVRAGCFRCLQAALSAFEGLAESPGFRAAARRGAFTTSVLLVVRSRELGLADDEVLARAQLWATRLPASAEHSRPAGYLDALRLIGGEASGLSPAARDRQTAARASDTSTNGGVPLARAALSQRMNEDVIAQYLALSIDCEGGQKPGPLDAAAIKARYPFPLIQFRLELCERTEHGLRQLRETDNRWVDTFFFEGTRELARYPAPDVARATEFFRQAHEHFPGSAAVTLALANALNALGEHESALPLFDELLSTEPAHRTALLGRLLSLSYMHRQTTAIQTATQLLDLGTYYQGEALYWRGWNRYRNGELSAAWQDVSQATTVLPNTSVYALAGVIAYARQWPETAIDRLSHAYRLDTTNCDAVWTESLVHADKEDWIAAGSRFSVAAICFREAAKQGQEEKAAAEASASRTPLRARSIDAAQKRIDTAEHRLAQAAFNAANSYARLAMKADALHYLEIAARHPSLKEKAMNLRAALDKIP